MNRKFLLQPILLAFIAAVVTGCASMRSQAPAEWDGLVLQPNSRLRAVWVKPDAEIIAYRSVKLDPVSVSFARDWDPNRGRRSPGARLDAGDIEAIQAGLADLVREGFRAELERGNYALVDEAGPETLRVTLAIVNLNITAPDSMTAGRGRTYTASSGSMTLVLEARDSISGDLLARAVDSQAGRGTGMMTITNRVTNTADARRAIGIWARALREALDQLYGRASG